MMLEQLRKLIDQGQYESARTIADLLYEQGENSEIFWILNAALYQIENNREAEFACITRGLRKNACSYELYYMLGEFYQKTNSNQAYLCMEQAEYYCVQSEQREDLEMIRNAKALLKKSGRCDVRPVSIIILSYNIKDIMIKCIESIRRTCAKISYEIIVVDNASTDGITDWLRRQQDIVLACNQENKGFAAGCNQGIALAAKENDIFLLNNDTVLPPNSLFWLRMGLYERATVGAVGPLTNYAGNDQQVIGNSESKEQYLKLAETICTPDVNSYEHKVWLVGFAMLIKRAAQKQVGGLDTRYIWGNYEDNDYGMQLTRAGYELLLCYNSFVYHYGSLNIAKNREKCLIYRKANEQRLREKWGFDSVPCNQVNQELLSQVKAEKETPIKVLHIGCGWGATLARLKYLYPNAEVYGIEESREKAEFGTYLADITVGNAWDMKLPYELHYFDYILVEKGIISVVPNVIEFQKKLRNYLNDHGELIGAEEEDSCLYTAEEYQKKILDYRQVSRQYLEQINRCLKERSIESIWQFLQIMQGKELREHCLFCMQELAYAHIFTIITIKEVQGHGRFYFLNNGSSVEALIQVLKRVEFRIWEMEFEGGKIAEDRLYEIITRYDITPEAMACIIVIAAMDKCNAFLTISCIYLEKKELEKAIALLACALEWYPNEHEIVQTLSQLYRKTGRQELAEQCEKKMTGE